MMRIKAFILLCFTIIQVFKAQPPSKFFNKFGSFGIDEGYSITETYNRQYALCGSTSSYGYGATDAIIMVIDSMGQKLWEKNYGGALTDVATSLLFNPADSGYYFTGFSNSIGNGGYDVYVVRTDKSGNILWQKSFGGIDWDFGRKMIFANDGNLLICGKTYSKSYGKSDAYILKVNNITGSLIWDKHFGGINDDEFRSVRITGDGHYLFAGQTNSYNDISGDIYFLKTNLNGDSVYTKTYGLINKTDFANDIAVESNTSYILGGGSQSYSSSLTDAYIFKINNNGDSLWLRNYGNLDVNQESTNVFHLNNTVGTYAITYSDINFAFYKRDPKGLILNNEGYYIVGNSFGETEDEELHEVVKTSDNGFIGVGYTNSYGSQLKDVFVVKFDSAFSYGGKLINVQKYFGFGSQLKVYPTLLSKELVEITIELDGEFNYALSDMTGRVIVHENKVNTQNVNKTKVDLSILEAGIYIINVQQNAKSSSIKIIKN